MKTDAVNTRRVCLVFLLLALPATETPANETAPSPADDPAKPARLSVSPSQLAGIFSRQDAKWATLRLEDVPAGRDEILVRLDCTDAYGRSTQLSPDPLILKREEGFARKLELQSGLGYYNVSCRLTAGEQGAEAEIGGGSFAYAVIPDNPVAGKDPQSPFGVCTHFNQGWPAEVGKLVKKAGIAWIYNDINQMNDVVVPVARENNLCYLPVFTWCKTPPEATRDEDGNWDFSLVAARYGEYAAKYGQDIDFYDLVGEPHGRWGAKYGGSWDGGGWQEPFVAFGRQVTQAIKAADPGAKVLWEDIDVFIWWRQFYELGAADTIDIIAPHPYNLHRSNPYPEDQPMLKQLPIFRRFVQEHNLPWRVWSDEVGFSSFRLAETTPQALYTPCTELQQAGLLVRMMVLQLANGVDKVFWYDFRNDGTNPTHPEHNFGLIRFDNSPKPALVAYANLVDQLRQSRWLGAYDIGGGGIAYAFVDRFGKAKLVAWVKQGNAAPTLRVPGNTRKVTVTELFGTSVTGRVMDHQYPLALSETPVYVAGLPEADIHAFLKE